MSRDVYEELGRLSAQEWDAYKSYVPGRESDRANPYIEGKSDGLEQAQRVVEFLRWRSAREEWPAEGCRCILTVDPLVYPNWLGEERPYFVRVASADREKVNRWRYALGPCECAKEGKP